MYQRPARHGPARPVSCGHVTAVAHAVNRRVKRVAGALARRLPPTLVRTAAGVRRPGARLTAVVPVGAHDLLRLSDFLAGIGRQRGRVDEVLLVVTAQGPDVDKVLARQGRPSWRVRVLPLPGASRAAAVTEGVRRAAGSLVMVCDAADDLAVEAVPDAIQRLEDGDADLVGASEADLGRARLTDLVFRKSLWALGPGAVAETPQGSWVAAARLLLAAERCAPGPVARQRGDDSGPERFGTLPRLAPTAGAWWQDVRDLLDRVEERRASAPFLVWLLDVELRRYLEDVERASDEDWEVLRSAARDLLAHISASDLAVVHVEPRVMAWLAAADERTRLEDLAADRWLSEGEFPIEVRDGVPYAVLAHTEGVVPAEVLALEEPDTPLDLSVRASKHRDDGRLELTVLAFVRRVEAAPDHTEARFWAVSPGGARAELTVSRSCDPEANLLARDRYADHTTEVYTVVLEPGSTALEAELTVAGVTRRCRLEPPVEPPVETPPGTWCADSVELDDEVLVVRGDVDGPHPDEATLHLLVQGRRVPGVTTVAGARFESRLPLRDDPWGLGERPVAGGTYRLVVSRPGAPTQRLAVSGEVTAASSLRSTDHRVRVHRGPSGGCLVTLAPPLADDEIGAFAQQELRRWYASETPPVDPGLVLLQSYTGRTPTDSPLAIHHALRRLRPELRLCWAVSDSSVPVPDGGEPVLVRSRAWYAALASAGHVVTNVDMEPWFVKRPGQRLLQTFHGYPSKTMGLGSWTSKNFTPKRIERLLRRTSGTWDLLLTPTPAMDVHYREMYRYDGEILATGYPRDDDLVSETADATRAATRARLGIRADQHAVLYAPTWRDDLATNFRAAEMSTTFDAAGAATALGDDYVVLVRGHRFHRRRDLGAGVLDVTDYPEINDLLHASDVAVLDYSSLRFDFALTGRPMVFLVPDLDRYESAVRGFLFDFRASAPGPLVSTTAEVVDRLRDLDALAREQRAVLDAFNAEYNPFQDGHAADRVVRHFFGPEDPPV